MQGETMRPDEIEVLSQLWWEGPVADGYVVSKDARNRLVKMGVAKHAHGYAYLTEAGVELCATMALSEWDKTARYRRLWSRHAR